MFKEKTRHGQLSERRDARRAAHHSHLFLIRRLKHRHEARDVLLAAVLRARNTVRLLCERENRLGRRIQRIDLHRECGVVDRSQSQVSQNLKQTADLMFVLKRMFLLRMVSSEE